MNSYDSSTTNFLASEFQRLGFNKIRKLGEGGMGIVLTAVDSKTGNEVAIKTLDSRFTRIADFNRRFRNEISIMRKLNHPAIVPVLGSGLTPSHIPYFTMEYIHGQDLHRMISEKSGSFTIKETINILAPIAAALDYIHLATPPIIHRDVKPGNILLPENSEHNTVLSDFGISLSLETNRITAEGSRVGTDPYLAPEIFEGFDATASSDIYSLGLIAYEMIGGSSLFSKNTKESWISARQLPKIQATDLANSNEASVRKLNSLFSKILHTDPTKRYYLAAEFITDLKRITPRSDNKRRSQPAPPFPPKPLPSPLETRSKSAHRAQRSFEAKELKRQLEELEASYPLKQKASTNVNSILPVQLIAGVIILSISIIGIAWFLRSVGSPWDEEHQALQTAFPELIAKKNGGTGWANTTCRPSDNSRLTAILCKGDDVSFQVVHQGDQRNKVIPKDMKLAQSNCHFLYASRTNNDKPSVLIAPKEPGQENATIEILGSNAARYIKSIPICKN